MRLFGRKASSTKADDPMVDSLPPLPRVECRTTIDALSTSVEVSDFVRKGLVPSRSSLHSPSSIRSKKSDKVSNKASATTCSSLSTLRNESRQTTIDDNYERSSVFSGISGIVEKESVARRSFRDQPSIDAPERVVPEALRSRTGKDAGYSCADSFLVSADESRDDTGIPYSLPAFETPRESSEQRDPIFRASTPIPDQPSTIYIPTNASTSVCSSLAESSSGRIVVVDASRMIRASEEPSVPQLRPCAGDDRENHDEPSRRIQEGFEVFNVPSLIKRRFNRRNKGSSGKSSRRTKEGNDASTSTDCKMSGGCVIQANHSVTKGYKDEISIANSVYVGGRRYVLDAPKMAGLEEQAAETYLDSSRWSSTDLTGLPTRQSQSMLSKNVASGRNIGHQSGFGMKLQPPPQPQRLDTIVEQSFSSQSASADMGTFTTYETMHKSLKNFTMEEVSTQEESVNSIASRDANASKKAGLEDHASEKHDGSCGSSTNLSMYKSLKNFTMEELSVQEDSVNSIARSNDSSHSSVATAHVNNYCVALGFGTKRRKNQAINSNREGRKGSLIECGSVGDLGSECHDDDSIGSSGVEDSGSESHGYSDTESIGSNDKGGFVSASQSPDDDDRNAAEENETFVVRIDPETQDRSTCAIEVTPAVTTQNTSYPVSYIYFSSEDGTQCTTLQAQSGIVYVPETCDNVPTKEIATSVSQTNADSNTSCSVSARSRNLADGTSKASFFDEEPNSLPKGAVEPSYKEMDKNTRRWFGLLHRRNKRQEQAGRVKCDKGGSVFNKSIVIQVDTDFPAAEEDCTSTYKSMKSQPTALEDLGTNSTSDSHSFTTMNDEEDIGDSTMYNRYESFETEKSPEEECSLHSTSSSSGSLHSLSTVQFKNGCNVFGFGTKHEDGPVVRSDREAGKDSVVACGQMGSFGSESYKNDYVEGVSSNKREESESGLVQNYPEAKAMSLFAMGVTSTAAEQNSSHPKPHTLTGWDGVSVKSTPQASLLVPPNTPNTTEVCNAPSNKDKGTCTPQKASVSHASSPVSSVSTKPAVRIHYTSLSQKEPTFIGKEGTGGSSDKGKKKYSRQLHRLWRSRNKTRERVPSDIQSALHKSSAIRLNKENSPETCAIAASSQKGTPVPQTSSPPSAHSSDSSLLRKGGRTCGSSYDPPKKSVPTVDRDVQFYPREGPSSSNKHGSNPCSKVDNANHANDALGVDCEAPIDKHCRRRGDVVVAEAASTTCGAEKNTFFRDANIGVITTSNGTTSSSAFNDCTPLDREKHLVVERNTDPCDQRAGKNSAAESVFKPCGIRMVCSDSVATENNINEDHPPRSNAKVELGVTEGVKHSDKGSGEVGSVDEASLRRDKVSDTDAVATLDKPKVSAGLSSGTLQLSEPSNDGTRSNRVPNNRKKVEIESRSDQSPTPDKNMDAVLVPVATECVKGQSGADAGAGPVSFFETGTDGMNRSNSQKDVDLVDIVGEIIITPFYGVPDVQDSGEAQLASNTDRDENHVVISRDDPRGQVAGVWMSSGALSLLKPFGPNRGCDGLVAGDEVNESNSLIEDEDIAVAGSGRNTSPDGKQGAASTDRRETSERNFESKADDSKNNQRTLSDLFGVGLVTTLFFWRRKNDSAATKPAELPKLPTATFPGDNDKIDPGDAIPPSSNERERIANIKQNSQRQIPEGQERGKTKLIATSDKHEKSSLLKDEPLLTTCNGKLDTNKATKENKGNPMPGREARESSTSQLPCTVHVHSMGEQDGLLAVDSSISMETLANNHNNPVGTNPEVPTTEKASTDCVTSIQEFISAPECPTKAFDDIRSAVQKTTSAISLAFCSSIGNYLGEKNVAMPGQAAALNNADSTNISPQQSKGGATDVNHTKTPIRALDGTQIATSKESSNEREHNEKPPRRHKVEHKVIDTGLKNERNIKKRTGLGSGKKKEAALSRSKLARSNSWGPGKKKEATPSRSKIARSNSWGPGKKKEAAPSRGKRARSNSVGPGKKKDAAPTKTRPAGSNSVGPGKKKEAASNKSRPAGSNTCSSVFKKGRADMGKRPKEQMAKRNVSCGLGKKSRHDRGTPSKDRLTKNSTIISAPKRKTSVQNVHNERARIKHQKMATRLTKLQVKTSNQMEKAADIDEALELSEPINYQTADGRHNRSNPLMLRQGLSTHSKVAASTEKGKHNKKGERPRTGSWSRW